MTAPSRALRAASPAASGMSLPCAGGGHRDLAVPARLVVPTGWKARVMLSRPWPIDRIVAGRAQIVGGLEQQVDDLRRGQVGKGLGDQRDRAGDDRRREAGAGIEEAGAGMVDRPDPVAERGEIPVLALPGPVGKGRQLVEIGVRCRWQRRPSRR